MKAKKPTTPHSRPIAARVTAEEYDRLKAAALAAGLSTSDYIRQRLFGRQPSYEHAHAALAELLRTLRRIEEPDARKCLERNLRRLLNVVRDACA